MVNGEFIVCSRNVNLVEAEGNRFWELARRYSVEEGMRAEGMDNIALQGEMCGEGIQGNKYQLKGHNFYLFKVYDIVAARYLTPNERYVVRDKLGLTHVPVLKFDAELVSDAPGFVEAVLMYAEGESALGKGIEREGVVFVNHDTDTHFKAISNKFLLKWDKRD